MDDALIDSIVRLVDALAWPVVAVIVAFMVRKPLASLITLIERVRYKDVEVNFRQLMEEATSKADAVSPLLDVPPIDERIQDLATVYPRGAIIESWLQVERAVADLAEARDLSVSAARQSSPRQLVGALQKAGILDENLAKLVTDLQAIRNGVVHAIDFSPSRNDAQEYTMTSARVITLLQGQ